MVVDDDTTNNMICEFNIKRFDKEADIEMFTIPEEALASIKEEYSSTREEGSTILFLDVNMPTMTGWEFLDVFMQLDEFVKDQFSIYILSSSIEDFKEKEEVYTFIQGFLSKPLKINNLEELRKDLLESRSY
jgi:CheY-like chemotaxis protein